MAAKRTLEEKLARLRAIRDEPRSPESLAEARKAIGSKTSLIAAAGAKIAGAHGLTELVAELVDAFDRFMADPVKRDPGCRAKFAVVEALVEFGARETDLYLRGLHHVQKEPAYGPPVDTADGLRVRCADGLSRFGYPDIILELTTLLTDSEHVARAGAAQVLAGVGTEAAEALLRMKVLVGDREPDVLGACFQGLLHMEPDRSLAFVAAYMKHPDSDVPLEAALALGESRHPRAVPVLKEQRESMMGKGRDRYCLPLALTRSEEAFDYLLEIVRAEPAARSAAALNALAILAADDARKQVIAGVVESRGDSMVRQAYAAEFNL